MNLKNLKFWKWADSLTPRQATLWCLALVACGVLSWWFPPLAAIVYLLVISWMIRAVRVSKSAKAIITALLIGSLAITGAPRRSDAQQQNGQPPIVECNAVIIGGLILVVGGFIIYKLVKFCQKNIPPPPPPPPPTPPTNNPAIVPMVSTVGHLQAISVNLTEPEQTTALDISHYGWMDYTIQTNPVPFQTYIHLTMSNSVDMNTWSNLYTIGVWLSSNSVETVIYNGSGVATHTNWTPGNPYTTALTNNIPFPVYNPSIPTQFFKYSQ